MARQQIQWFRIKKITTEKYYLTVLMIAVLAGIPVISVATNGYFAHGYGARSKAMAGAATALPQDAFAAAINPAGVAYLGNRLDIEVTLFSPHRQFTVEGSPTLAPGTIPLNPGTVESDSLWFPFPSFGWSHKIDTRQLISLSFYSSGGVNTDYVAKDNPLCGPDRNGVFCAGTAGVDFEQAFLVPAYARSFSDGKFSLGIAPIFAVQRFKARGLNTFAVFSGDAKHLSNQGYDYSYGGGVRIGALAIPIPGLRLGASYKSRIFMSPFSEYSGLIADKGDFDIPESFNFGISWDINDQFTADFDIEHIRYSQINALGNSLLPNIRINRLGDKAGPALGLRDMTIFKLGTQWRQNRFWTWRAGISYGQQPIPNSEVLLNTLVPGVEEFHLTTGFSWTMDTDDELSFAFSYSPNKSVKGPNPLSSGQTIELQMYQISFQLAWSRRF